MSESVMGPGEHVASSPKSRVSWVRADGPRSAVFLVYGFAVVIYLITGLKSPSFISGGKLESVFVLASVLGVLSPLTLDTAIELLSLPDRIRGYGPVKEKSVQDAKARYAQLAADLANPPPAPRQIAAE